MKNSKDILINAIEEVSEKELMEVAGGKKDFRNISAFVSQDSPIFDGDVMYNISLGRESVSGKQVIETCKRVSIYDDIMSMPMNFHTLLFRENPSISGGQKQRISLARELVTTPRILVLDEPTSALDVKTERIIQKMLRLYIVRGFWLPTDLIQLKKLIRF